MRGHLHCQLQLWTLTALLLCLSSLLSPLSNWPTGLVKDGRDRWQKEAGKFRNYTERYSATEQMGTATEKEADTKTKSSLGRISTCLLRLSSSFPTSLLSHPLCLHSFCPMLPASLVPLVASVFHFKLDCRYPNLIGCWAKSETKKQWENERQTDWKRVWVIQYEGRKKNWWEDSRRLGGNKWRKTGTDNTKWNTMMREKREVRIVERRGTKVEEESCNKLWFKSLQGHRQLWTGGISG